MRYSSGVRYSRAKPVGSFRVFQPNSRAVASHDETLQDARKSAAYWTSAVGSPMEVQERFPSGEWVTIETAHPKRLHATKKESAVQASYVKLKGLRGFDAYAVQLPSDNQWGFELAKAEGEWSQSWPGGFGLATEWTTVPKAKVPAKVRSEMDWLLDQ